METISYEYEGALYVNLTNRCDCACVFCLRHNGHKGSIYADDLWLDHEPTRREALEDLLSRDISVICVFTGEDKDLPAAHTIYGRCFARSRDLHHFADTVGTLIQNQIRGF